MCAKFKNCLVSISGLLVSEITGYKQKHNHFYLYKGYWLVISILYIILSIYIHIIKYRYNMSDDIVIIEVNNIISEDISGE